MAREREEMVWRETRGTEEIAAEERKERERIARIESGLAKCSVCGGGAKWRVFGLEGHGVWVGCDRSAECSEYIEIQTEGWSLEEVAAEWNRYNSGVFGIIRRMKRWIKKRFGARKRAENREKAAKRAKIEEERAKRAQIFGVEREKRAGRWWKIWRKGNK